MRQVINELDQIRRRGRFMLIVQRFSVVATWFIAVASALIVADFLLRLPGVFRLILLLSGITACLYFLWTYFRPAVSFKPTLTQLALRVERVFPVVAGRLASSVEFAATGLDVANPLAARAVRDTESRLAGESVHKAMRSGRTVRDLAFMVGLIVIVGVTGFMNPIATATGVSRLFAPLSDARWPARTRVESMMPELVGEAGVHPRGEALPLRARVTRGRRDQSVNASYRVELDGAFGDWQRILLTFQRDDIHERLVDSNADAIELYFETADWRTDTERVELIPPPAVVRALLTVTPPSYAAAWYPATEADLGQGFDNRAVTATPALVGSWVSLALDLNKPLPTPQTPEQLAAVLGWAGGVLPEIKVDKTAPGTWTLQWTLRQTRTLNLHLEDNHGLRNAELIAYRIEAIEDRPASVTVIDPEADRVVLPSAVVPLVAEARDDVAVASIGLGARIQRAGQSQPGEGWDWETKQDAFTPAARHDSVIDLGQLDVVEGDIVFVFGVSDDVYDLDGNTHETAQSPPRRLRVISELELAGQLRRNLGAVRQNAIRIDAQQAELQDDIIERGVQPGVDRAQAQISERIAAQRELIEQIERSMDENRLDDAQLDRLIEQAGDLLDYAGRAAAEATEAIEQRRTSDAAPNQTGDRADDQQQADADAPRDRPGERSDRLAERAGDQPETDRTEPGEGRDDPEAAEQQPDEFADDPEAPVFPEPAAEDRPIVDRQQEVRDELADLISLLDRDEDTWVATTQIEGMLREQMELEAATAQIGRETMGRSVDELTPDQRTELDRIADRQRDLAEKARNTVEDMHRRSDNLEDVDPQAADAMRNAADTGEQREVARDMENAADDARQNRTRSARESQQAARETLERMLDEIRQTDGARAEELIRRLASLLESIERLITVQENELAALAGAVADDDFAGRDRAMIRLHQNTQSVAAEARSAGQESRRIARALDRAGDAQGAAVTALRARPADPDAADEAETYSLEVLREAKAMAEELQEQTQQEELLRQRAELIELYRALAERQVALRATTLELAGHEKLNRRQLMDARRYGNQQDTIRTELGDIRATNSDINDSAVFSHVHQLIDDWARQVTDALQEGDVGIDVTDRQLQIAESIGRLIEAIQELMQPAPEFEGNQPEEQGGGGGEGSGGGQTPVIPQLAELQLLRGMQEHVYNHTRGLDGREDLDPAQRKQRLSELGDQQQQLLDLGRQIAESLQRTPPSPATNDSNEGPQ